MTREAAMQRMFVLWLAILPLPVLIVSAQTVAGKYGGDAGLAWSWLLGQVAPVLALLLAAVFSNPSRHWRKAAASPLRWRFALGASLLQGAAMLTVLLIEPMLSATPYELFDATGVVLSLLQGLVVAAVGGVVFDGR